MRLLLSPSLRRFAAVVAACALSTVVLAQNDQPQPDAGNNNDNNGGGRRARRGQNGNGGRGNFDPQQMQERMMNALREQFGVKDDAEWQIISERVQKVLELRRTAGGGFGGGFTALRGGNGGGRGRFGGNASPEQEALRQAVTDNLPDAEIKSRLERLREVRKENADKLAKAQEDLRAVLGVRQEAVAVMAGLLP